MTPRSGERGRGWVYQVPDQTTRLALPRGAAVPSLPPGRTPSTPPTGRTLGGIARAQPGQDPVGHGAGATDPAEPNSDICNNNTNIRTYIIHNNNTNEDEDGTRPPAARSSGRPQLRVDLTYGAAGSYKTANGVWRGGVLLGSLCEANKRMEGRIDDCRGWGRYIGRIYQGASKKTMVVIEAYFPGATYEANDATREDYSQTLGARASAPLPGASATR